MQRWQISGARQVALALVMTVATFAALAPHSLAIVPPRSCGTLTATSKHYAIKADQLSCTTARSHARRYLASKAKPSGYSCRNYGAETKLKFRCTRGVKVFFAIRR